MMIFPVMSYRQFGELTGLTFVLLLTVSSVYKALEYIILSSRYVPVAPFTILGIVILTMISGISLGIAYFLWFQQLQKNKP